MPLYFKFVTTFKLKETTFKNIKFVTWLNFKFSVPVKLQKLIHILR